MRIGIIGQGVAGLFLGIMLKMEHKNFEITLIDKNINPGKKILATGNGRCNLCNLDVTKLSYNNDLAFEIVSSFGPNDIIEFLESLGIATRNLGSLVYPYSLSAKQLLETLIDRARALKINFENHLTVSDYMVLNNTVEVITNKKVFAFEKVIFATGSASAKNLGGTFDIYNLLQKHGYKIVTPKVGLAPFKTIEETRTIESQRVKCDVKLFIDKEDVYSENGEVIFKKNGLSGIAIFNVTSMIARNKKFKKAIISLDLLPEYDEKHIFDVVKKSKFEKNSGLLQCFLPKPVAEYIRKRAKIDQKENVNDEEILSLIRIAKNLTFTYLESYSFDDSQVTVGGVSLDCVNSNLESLLEKNLYFAGELLDVDGLCGGFNIMFAISSARRIADSFNQ